MIFYTNKYSKVPLLRPPTPLGLIKRDFNSEIQLQLNRYLRSTIKETVLILSGLYIQMLLYTHTFS